MELLYPELRVLARRWRAFVSLGRWAEAVPIMRRAVSSWETSSAGGTYDLAGDRFALAQALWQSRTDRDEALVIARQALEALQSLPAEQLPLRDDVVAWIEERAGR